MLRVAISSHQLRPPRRGGRPPPLEQGYVQHAAGLLSGSALMRGCTWDWYRGSYKGPAKLPGPPQGGPPCRFPNPLSLQAPKVSKGRPESPLVAPQSVIPAITPNTKQKRRSGQLLRSYTCTPPQEALEGPKPLQLYSYPTASPAGRVCDLIRDRFLTLARGRENGASRSTSERV